MKLLFFLGCLIQNTIVLGSEREQRLFDVISEPQDGKVYQVNLILKEDFEITQLDFISSGAHDFYPIEELINGVDLFNVDNRTVLKIEGNLFNPKSGGEVKIKYLVNGLFGKYSEKGFRILRESNQWFLYLINGGKKIKTMILKSNKILGKIVGIKDIEVKYF
jgi:hypothetical protein